MKTMWRVLDVSSELIAKALVRTGQILEIAFFVIEDILGRILVTVLVIAFVIGVIWLVKYL